MYGQLIANKPTRELIGMAQEKIVEVTVDRDLTEAPASPIFQKSHAPMSSLPNCSMTCGALY